MVVVFGQGGGRDSRVPEHVQPIAGLVKGAPRLGVPDLPLFPPLATSCTSRQQTILAAAIVSWLR